MTAPSEPFRLSSPPIYLVRMVVFLVLVGFTVLILQEQIKRAFLANPGLNSLIFFVLFIGIILALQQVWRLFTEVRWINSLQNGRGFDSKLPQLLAPMARMLGARGDLGTMSPQISRVMLDSVASRLDESRDTLRYLTGLLIFLGLLGTFWGLLNTVASISNVIDSMQAGGDTNVMFDDLKTGLKAPIAGMSVSFVSSLFGLAGSLILGFLDLQAAQAQNRFFNELEDLLATRASPILVSDSDRVSIEAELRQGLIKIEKSMDQSQSRLAAGALTNLAEGVQGLVHHMRDEQQMIRDWVEAQASQQREVKALLHRLLQELERR